MNRFFAIVFFLIISQFAVSQRAVFDKQEVTVGDRFELSLEIPLNAGKDIRFPLFEKELVPGIEIVEQSKIETDKDANVLKQLIRLCSFEDSLFLIKGFDFIVDGDTLRTNPLRLKVSYFKPDSAFAQTIDTAQFLKISDIKGPIDAPVTFREFMARFAWYIVIVLIALVLVFFLWCFFKKRKKNEKPLFVREEPKIPAHIAALERIANLKKKALHKKADLKPFYTQLSNIIRMYMEERFDIPALESVTYEILADFEKTEFSNDEINKKLQELLSLSDMVKFAKNEPDDYRNEMMLEYAESFIQKTKERVVDTSEEADKSDEMPGTGKVKNTAEDSSNKL